MAEQDIVERLRYLAKQARKCIPAHYYLHANVDATFTEVASWSEEAANEIERLQAPALEAAAYERAAEILDELKTDAYGEGEIWILLDAAARIRNLAIPSGGK